jgi:hypothetical protein
MNGAQGGLRVWRSAVGLSPDTPPYDDKTVKGWGTRIVLG